MGEHDSEKSDSGNKTREDPEVNDSSTSNEECISGRSPISFNDSGESYTNHGSEQCVSDRSISETRFSEDDCRDDSVEESANGDGDYDEESANEDGDYDSQKSDSEESDFEEESEKNSDKNSDEDDNSPENYENCRVPDMSMNLISPKSKRPSGKNNFLPIYV